MGTLSLAPLAVVTWLGLSGGCHAKPVGQLSPAVPESSAAASPAAGKPPLPAKPGEGECSDGIDNDGDGLVDWQLDLGCYGPDDPDERAGPRTEEGGFTTFDVPADSVVVYVAANGNDASTGLTPDRPVRTLARAAQQVRDGRHDFIRLRRGDTWRLESLERFKSGEGPGRPMVITTYGSSRQRPIIESDTEFVDHNGKPRSYLAIVGLRLVHIRKSPKDPAFDGEGKGLLRFVGAGSHILVEGCQLEYGGIHIQGSDSAYYDNVEIRRSVVREVYATGTCKEGDRRGNVSERPSGVFSRHVRGLRLEENLFDHNGWSENVDSACATIYNHNVYLNASDLTIVGNVFSRASSIHIKLKSSSAGDMQGVEISDNFMVEGEVGVSIGGNNDAKGRFSDVLIQGNVLLDIGRTRPTKRDISWGIEIKDHARSKVSDNYVIWHDPAGVRNAYGIGITSQSQSNLEVSRNFFYGVPRRGLLVQSTAGHENVVVKENTFVDPAGQACLVKHEGPLTGYAYSANRYQGPSAGGTQLCVEHDHLNLAAWSQRTGDSGSTQQQAPAYVDPDRDLDSYGRAIGVTGGLPALLALLAEQGHLSWDERMSARAINRYLRAGFEAAPARE